MNDITIDTFFEGRIQVKQNRSGYRFSIDAVLLAYYVRAGEGEKVVDLGTGCGIIPLILSYRHQGVRVVGVEVQEELAALANHNVRDNGMADRVSVLCADFKMVNPDAVSGPADWIVCNPPYRKAKSGRVNPDRERAIARHEIMATLRDILDTAHRLLKVSGRFITIYPAERMVDIITQMRSSGIEPKRIRIIYSRYRSEGKLILVEGTKGGRAGIKIAPPLAIYKEDGSYTEEVSRMFQP